MTTDKQAVERVARDMYDANPTIASVVDLMPLAEAAIASLTQPKADDTEMCDACNGSGFGVADTYCGKCGGAGGYPVQPKADEDLVEMVERLRTVAAYTGIPLGESNRRALREAANLIERLAAISTPPTGD